MKVREVREEDRDDSEVKGKNVVVEDKLRVYKAVVDQGSDGAEVSVTNGVVGTVESAEVHAVIV
jgi:hypothetical protein